MNESSADWAGHGERLNHAAAPVSTSLAVVINDIDIFARGVGSIPRVSDAYIRYTRNQHRRSDGLYKAAAVQDEGARLYCVDDIPSTIRYEARCTAR